VSYGVGAGEAGLGIAALAAAAIAPKSARMTTICLEPGACPPPPHGFKTLCDAFHPNASPCGGPIYLAPLGYALVAAGVFTGGAAFLADPEDDDWAWLWPILGLALGALTYGLSAAVGGG
jgi:hypothetical protein